MKVLVTGGSGFLGVHLRRYFDADDFSRRGGVDVLNLADVRRVEDYDAVIHLAAHLDKSPENAEESFLVNVEGTVNLLQAMLPNTVFIFASTRDVYGKFADNFAEVPETCPTDFNGQSALEWSKLIAERYVEFYAARQGFRSAIFRLSTVYAPRSEGNEPNFVGHYADMINRGEVLHLPFGGRPVRDLLHVDDLGYACRRFMDGEIRQGLYNIGGGRENALSLEELAAKMEEVSGLQAVIEKGDEAEPPVPQNYISDITKAREELGWIPQISLEEGLKTLF
ncbi:MAG TPA: NAD-dependent epimerase/dehydratase family protein [Pyrinomonadaceae bacterium]|jgi:nucleoside-diphosphate-sugar epimerase|nr:NAD-dependent epimerase/dehydratase family protein [Pyrinomonadaceae bacterium]